MAWGEECTKANETDLVLAQQVHAIKSQTALNREDLLQAILYQLHYQLIVRDASFRIR